LTLTASIVDTGTSILILQDAIVKDFYNAVPGSSMGPSGFIFPCNSKLPDLSISFGESYTAKIPGSSLIFNKVAGTDDCFGALQSNNGQQMQVLGVSFFNNQFVVFDGGKKRLGMASQ
jgi:hypothetical protein